MGAPPYAHGVKPYFGLYGIGQFDGQNSGHDFFGTVGEIVARAACHSIINLFFVGFSSFNGMDQ